VQRSPSSVRFPGGETLRGVQARSVDAVRAIAEEHLDGTVVIVTHNLFQAKRLADRAALLLDGRLVEVAPAKDIFENPQRAETRAFLTGEMAY